MFAVLRPLLTLQVLFAVCNVYSVKMPMESNQKAPWSKKRKLLSRMEHVRAAKLIRDSREQSGTSPATLPSPQEPRDASSSSVSAEESLVEPSTSLDVVFGAQAYREGNPGQSNCISLIAGSSVRFAES